MPIKKQVEEEVDEQTLAELRASATPMSTYYFPVPGKKPITVKKHSAFEVQSSFNNGKPWRWSKVTIKGEVFDIRCHQNKALDTTVPCYVVKYAAREAFKATNGTLVPKGNVQWRAQAKL